MACDAPPKRRNWRLYHLLDFIQPVSTLQVKYTARKATLRTQYYHAYLTLSEVNRKFYYDIGGEASYDFISSGTWGPLIPSMGLRAYSFIYFLVLMIEVCLLIAFFVLLGLRTDDPSLTSWQKVAIPLLVFMCIMLLTVFVAMIVCWAARKPTNKTFADRDRLSPVGNFLAAVCYLVTTCLFFSALQSEAKMEEKVGKYILYLVPLMVGDSIYYLTSFLWRGPTFIKRLMKIDGNAPSAVVYGGIFLMGFLHWFCAVAQWVFIGLKLDGKLTWNWYYIFLPFAVRALLRWIEAILRAALRHTQLVRGSLGVAFDVLSAFFSNGILIISLYWVAVRIEEGKYIVRMGVALVPVYLTLLYMFICLIITLIISWSRQSTLESEEIRLNHLWTPPDDNSSLESKEVPGEALRRRGGKGDTRAGYEPFNDTTDDGGASQRTQNSFPSDLEAHKEKLDDFDSENGDTPNASPVQHEPDAIQNISHDPFGPPTDEEEEEYEEYEDEDEEEEEEVDPRNETAEYESETGIETFSDASEDDTSSFSSAERRNGDERHCRANNNNNNNNSEDDEEDSSRSSSETRTRSRGRDDNDEDSDSYEYVDEELYEDYTEDVTPQSRDNHNEEKRKDHNVNNNNNNANRSAARMRGTPGEVSASASSLTNTPPPPHRR